jgi:hypothetical protein
MKKEQPQAGRNITKEMRSQHSSAQYLIPASRQALERKQFFLNLH